MRRARPLGLTIALAACTLLYGLYPLALGLFYVTMAVRRQASGLDARAALTLLTSVGFLVLLIPAWRGRPPRVRLILTLAVLALAVLNLAFAATDLLAPAASGGALLDTLSEAERTVNLCAFPVYGLVTLYVVWYLNRRPSRNFYGG